MAIPTDRFQLFDPKPDISGQIKIAAQYVDCGFHELKGGKSLSCSLKSYMLKPLYTRVIKMLFIHCDARFIHWPLSAKFGLNPVASFAAQ